jgi:hypothetical protein
MEVKEDNTSGIHMTSRKFIIQLGGKYCTIFSELGIAIKLVRLIKKRLIETYN